MTTANRSREHRKKAREYERFLRDDADWDYAYILRLLKYKLERTRRCIVSNNIVVSASKIGRQIAKVEELLARVLADQYFEEIGGPFQSKYGRLRMVTGRARKGERSVPVSFKFTKETKANSDQIRREHRALMHRAERLRRRDLAKAFRLMEEHIWGWWD